MDRQVVCPRCEKQIRVTEVELAQKRAFCALCDARFDLLAEMLGDGDPMRSLEVYTPRALGRPPTSYMALEDGVALVIGQGAPTLTWVVPTALAGVGTALMAYSMLSLSHAFAGFVWMAGIAVAICALVGGRAHMQARGREQVRVAGRELVWRRQLLYGRWRVDRVAVTDVQRVRMREVASTPAQQPMPTRYHVEVQIGGREPLLIGRGLHMSQAAAEWLCEWLERGLAQAR
jgi:hypothetical protein